MGRVARAQQAHRMDAPDRGEHICWSYRSEDERRVVLTTFLLEGLSRNERVCYFGFGGSELALMSSLRDAGTDIRDLANDDRIVIGDAVDAYVPNGVFDGSARLDGFEALAQATLDEGFAGLRVAAETGWLLDDPVMRASWPAYEVRVELLLARMPIVGMCSFDARTTDPEALSFLASLHKTSAGIDAGTSRFNVHSVAPGALAITGDFDSAVASRAGEAILGAVDDLTAATIDLSDLSFVDAAGVQTIASLVEAIDARGRQPLLYGVSPHFRRLWSLLEVDPGKRAAFA